MIGRCREALLLVGLCVLLPAQDARAAVRCPEVLASGIPVRSAAAPDGRDFARRIAGVDGSPREAAIAAELQAGNMPGFVRRLEPIVLRRQTPDRQAQEITLCVAEDYLAVGSDRDFLRVPMGLPTAMNAAAGFGFVLPTKAMVDVIYAQATLRLAPQPLAAGDAMRSTAYYAHHDHLIAAQRQALPASDGFLTAGHKKDLVLTNRLWTVPGRVAIYGWHRPDGRPIQPLSTVHGARYADYSHGVRLVSLVAYVDGAPRSLVDLLEDPRYAGTLTGEGPIAHVAELAAVLSGSAERAADLVRMAKRLIDALGVTQSAMHR